MSLSRCPECQAIGGHLADCPRNGAIAGDPWLPENLAPVPAGQRRYFYRYPKCGNDEQFVKATAWLLLTDLFWIVAGTFIYALLWSDYMRGAVACPRCGHAFVPPRIPNSAVAKLAGWITIIVIFGVFGALLCVITPALEEMLPSLSGLKLLEELIAAQPRTAAYLVAGLIATILPVCCIAAWVSNLRYRRLLAGRYLLKPKSKTELARQNETISGE